MQPRYPQQTPNTLGGGYIAGDIPLPSAQPQQQAAAAHAPTAAAAGTPWSFGQMGDIQHTTGNEELSTQLYREASELESFARQAHSQGIDVTRPDASNPEALKYHRAFQDKLWRLRNLQAQLQQGRAHEKAYLQGVASGKILPSHINQGMPFGTQQAASALAHQNEIPEVHDYQKRHAGYMGAAAQGHLNPSMRDMAIQDYNRAVASVQARAQQYGHDQSWVQTQVNRIPPPPTESGTTRKVVTQENTQSGWHEAINPEYAARAKARYGSGGQSDAIGDVFKGASIITGHDMSGHPDITSLGMPAQAHNFRSGMKLGNGTGAPTILHVQRDAVSGKTGWVAQDPPTVRKGKKIPGAIHFHEWQRDPITHQYDLLAELKRSTPEAQYKQIVKTLVANGYVHVDRNGHPTEIANLDTLMQALGDEQPESQAAQQSPTQQSNTFAFTIKPHR